MEEVILKVNNLKVKLQEERIIDTLSFELKRGQVLTILGPNGAGKTVLLKTLLGIFPFEGEVEWKKGTKFAYVPQRVPFFKEIPLLVEEFLAIKQKVKKEEIRKVIKLIGFEEGILKKKIGELSSGQYQRVLIAFALLGSPNVLLFDEFTSGIDISGQESIYQFLDRLKKEKNLTIIFVTHDISVVFKFSDFVICLNKCSVCQGVPKKVITPENLAKIYGQEVKFYEHYHGH